PGGDQGTDGGNLHRDGGVPGDQLDQGQYRRAERRPDADQGQQIGEEAVERRHHGRGQGRLLVRNGAPPAPLGTDVFHAGLLGYGGAGSAGDAAGRRRHHPVEVLVGQANGGGEHASSRVVAQLVLLEAGAGRVEAGRHFLDLDARIEAVAGRLL